ncbi:MAG TPA: hypothetical protein DEQ14_08770, partial [Treponema sp.]|nr:hypothetical protein [Treponema sp.]
MGKIRDGAVCIVLFPCSEETSIAVESISKARQWIVCLLNQVFIRVEGEMANNGIDGADKSFFSAENSKTTASNFFTT